MKSVFFSFGFCLLLVFANFSLKSQNREIDSLEREFFNRYEKDGFTDSVDYIITQLSTMYSTQNPQKVIKFIYRVIEKGNTINSNDLLISGNSALARIFSQQGMPEKAIEFQLRCLYFYNANSNVYSIGWMKIEIGNNYYSCHSYGKAIKYYEDAFKIFQIKKDKNGNLIKTPENVYYNCLIGMAVSENNIALCFEEMGKYKEALDLHRKALNIRMLGVDTLGIAYGLGYVGLSYSHLDYPDSAKIYLDSAINTIERFRLYSKDYKNIIGLGEHYSDLGDYYVTKGDFDHAYKAYLSAIKNFSQLDLKNALIVTYYQIAEMFIKKKEYNKALGYTRQAINGFGFNNYNYQLKGYLLLSKIYTSTGNYKEANKNQLLYISLQDSLLNINQKIELEELESRIYEQYKIERLNLLTKENKIQSLQLSKTKNLITFLLITVILVLLVVAILLFDFIYRKKSARLLLATNEALNENNLALLKSESNLKEINNAKDKLFSIIAHDLRNPLNAFLGLTDIMVKEIREMSKLETEEMVQHLRNAAHTLHGLLENLLEWALMNRGVYSFNPEPINLKQISLNCTQSFASNLQMKQLVISNNISEDLKCRADTKMLESIFRNLISNAIKFSHRKGGIIISAKQTENNFIEISVTDFGIGMDEKTSINIFKLGEIVVNKGTEGESSSGLGLILCKEFVEKHSGSIWAESSPGKGATFRFTMPASS